MKSSWGVDEAEIYNYKLIKVISILKSSLLFVSFFNLNKVKSTFKVDFSKVLYISKTVL